eukprot:3640030-Pleurochrysis_carterae.AAC.1
MDVFVTQCMPAPVSPSHIDLSPAIAHSSSTLHNANPCGKLRRSSATRALPTAKTRERRQQHGMRCALVRGPLQGRARSESVARTDSLEPRTPELACFTILILYGSLAEFLTSGRAGATNQYKIRTVGGWELAQARGLGRAYAVAQGRWLEGAAAAITSEFSKSLGSRAPAPLQ